jgi:hypothetical protein
MKIKKESVRKTRGKLKRNTSKQKYAGLLALKGKIQWTGNLNEMRRGRIFELASVRELKS